FFIEVTAPKNVSVRPHSPNPPAHSNYPFSEDGKSERGRHDDIDDDEDDNTNDNGYNDGNKSDNSERKSVKSLDARTYIRKTQQLRKQKHHPIGTKKKLADLYISFCSFVCLFLNSNVTTNQDDDIYSVRSFNIADLRKSKSAENKHPKQIHKKKTAGSVQQFCIFFYFFIFFCSFTHPSFAHFQTSQMAHVH
ncbi:hypothetical protein RFI_08356, partial [Reticulomyxa filosa]